MESKISKESGATNKATLIYFDDYTVHYYSQSSNTWEAAYINCFQNTSSLIRQAGYIVFTYNNGTTPLGHENPIPGTLPTMIPPTQVNRLEKRDGKDFFFIYYDISRFNDVVNLLRYCAKGNQSMFVSADPAYHVWALGNNLHVQLAAQYKV